jgi:type II secretory pathway pseudopilin PulG
MQRQSGFTVIEVILFLGFTAMLFLIALFGTSAFVGETRFGDSMRRLESYMQAQYDEVVSGQNPRSGAADCNSAGVVTTGGAGTSPGSNINCLLLGKVVLMTAASGTLDSYYVVGVEPSSPPPATASVAQVIEDYNPRIVPTEGKTTFEVPWGVTFTSGKRATMPNAATGVAFIRSPKSSQVMTYVFSIPNIMMFGVGGGLDPINNPAVSTGTTANYCFESPDTPKRSAALQILNGQGSVSITTKFNVDVSTLC